MYGYMVGLSLQTEAQQSETGVTGSLRRHVLAVGTVTTRCYTDILLYHGIFGSSEDLTGIQFGSSESSQVTRTRVIMEKTLPVCRVLMVSILIVPS